MTYTVTFDSLTSFSSPRSRRRDRARVLWRMAEPSYADYERAQAEVKQQHETVAGKSVLVALSIARMDSDVQMSMVFTSPIPPVFDAEMSAPATVEPSETWRTRRIELD